MLTRLLWLRCYCETSSWEKLTKSQSNSSFRRENKVERDLEKSLGGARMQVHPKVPYSFTHSLKCSKANPPIGMRLKESGHTDGDPHGGVQNMKNSNKTSTCDQDQTEDRRNVKEQNTIKTYWHNIMGVWMIWKAMINVWVMDIHHPHVSVLATRTLSIWTAWGIKKVPELSLSLFIAPDKGLHQMNDCNVNVIYLTSCWVSTSGSNQIYSWILAPIGCIDINLDGKLVVFHHP